MLNNVAALFAGGTPADTNAYESIATHTVGAGGQSSVTFSVIPSTYKHLQLRAFWKLASSTNLIMNANSDTGSNYKTHLLGGDGSSVYAGVSSVSPNALGLGYAGTSAFSVTVCDILDYTDTNKNKVIRYLMGDDNNGSGDVEFGSGLWINTSAISSLVIKAQNSGNIQEYSSFALYGIKG